MFQAVDMLPSGSKPPLAAPTAGARTPSPGVQLVSAPSLLSLLASQAVYCGPWKFVSRTSRTSANTESQAAHHLKANLHAVETYMCASC